MGDLAPAPTAEELFARGSWPHELGPYEALGQRYRILTTDSALARFLDELYSPMTLAGAGARDRSRVDSEVAVYRVIPPSDGQQGTVLRGTDILGSSGDRARILGLLQWAINRRVLERACIDRLVLHAGAVDRDGSALLLAGRMEAGKTTLTTGLLERGFRYLTDEAVAVDRDLTAEGYPKPLSIDPGAWKLFAHLEPQLGAALSGYLDRQWQVPAGRLAPVVATSRVAALVLTKYETGAPTAVAPLSPAAAVAELARCTFVPEDVTMPASRVRDLAALAAAVPVHRMVSGDLQAACTAATEVFDAAVAAQVTTVSSPTSGQDRFA